MAGQQLREDVFPRSSSPTITRRRRVEATSRGGVFLCFCALCVAFLDFLLKVCAIKSWSVFFSCLAPVHRRGDASADGHSPARRKIECQRRQAFASSRRSFRRTENPHKFLELDHVRRDPRSIDGSGEDNKITPGYEAILKSFEQHQITGCYWAATVDYINKHAFVAPKLDKKVLAMGRNGRAHHSRPRNRPNLEKAVPQTRYSLRPPLLLMPSLLLLVPPPCIVGWASFYTSIS